MPDVDGHGDSELSDYMQTTRNEHKQQQQLLSESMHVNVDEKDECARGEKSLQTDLMVSCVCVEYVQTCMCVGGVVTVGRADGESATQCIRCRVGTSRQRHYVAADWR
jgi:hypothetical protein